jgi:hypothetical protein
MKALYLVVAAAIALPACSSMETESARRKCDDNREGIVAVDGEIISVSPEPIVVCKQNAKVTWTLASDAPAGYEFADLAKHGKKGIDITDPNAQFDNCNVESNGSKYSCFDKSTVKGAYKYIINLRKPDGSILKSIDPHVVND